MDTNKIYSELKSKFPKLEIYQNHPLAPYTTIKIGGPADIFIHIKSSQDFKNILTFICDLKSNIYPTILGNGSNILISDSGIRGIVIKNNSSSIKPLPNYKLEISSGTQLNSAIKFLAQHQLSNLEEFSYIPASIGGAIYSNIHGFDKTNFSQLIESIEIFNLKTGEIKNIIPDQSQWNYDHSPLQTQPNLVIISAILKLKPGNTKDIQNKADTIYKDKSTKQLMNSLGCTFKNPSVQICQPIWGEPKGAGWIIDNELKFKGKSIGDAQISPLHANFIVNKNKATAKDYLDLVNLIQSKMQTKFNFQFELEIKLIGDF
jgi:UDP-N-acetylmuramate dehydrogenase